MTKTASKPRKRKPGEWEQEFVAQLEKQGAWPPKLIKAEPPPIRRVRRPASPPQMDGAAA